MPRRVSDAHYTVIGDYLRSPHENFHGRVDDKGRRAGSINSWHAFSCNGSPVQSVSSQAAVVHKDEYCAMSALKD